LQDQRGASTYANIRFAVSGHRSIDWRPAKLQDEQIAECVENMSTPDGLLVAGSRYTVTGEAGAAPGRIATAAYYRLTDAK
jgi:hypothetical protein